MATVAETRLFPPIMAPYLPAKDINTVNQGISISFDINELNNIEDIKEIHVIITRQTNYNSLFNHTLYPLGIYPITVGQTTVLQDGVITIPSRVDPSDPTSDVIIDVGELNFNEYYKVQLRFSGVECCGNTTGAELSNILLNESYMAQFSEWSSVSSMRFIAQPSFELRGNVNTGTLSPSPQNPQTISSNFLSLYGSFSKQGNTIVLGKTYTNSDDKEYLSSWQIKVIEHDSEEVKVDSGVQTLNYRGAKIDEIQYDVPFYFINDIVYDLELTIVTSNLYTNTYTYQVEADTSENSWTQQNYLTEYTSIDSVIGKVNVTFEPKTEQTVVPAGGDLIIRRADRQDNFTRWEQIWHYHFNESYDKDSQLIVFNDFTIESGMIYKYSISYIPSGSNTAYSIVEGPVLSVFDHAFLTGEGTQLCVKFNPNINNMKINVSDNMVNTIGGQYPIVSRNGNMYYRSFALSGTIAYEMDAEHQFATRSSIYDEWISVYGSYFVNRFINQYNDRITQREFRELVINYLYSDQPKLFRSTPEGNILVRLTDINLTPNTQLGRMIYDFSCTATEIGDCSIENYKLYKIQDFGE